MTKIHFFQQRLLFLLTLYTARSCCRRRLHRRVSYHSPHYILAFSWSGAGGTHGGVVRPSHSHRHIFPCRYSLQRRDDRNLRTNQPGGVIFKRNHDVPLHMQRSQPQDTLRTSSLRVASSKKKKQAFEIVQVLLQPPPNESMMWEQNHCTQIKGHAESSILYAAQVLAHGCTCDGYVLHHPIGVGRGDNNHETLQVHITCHCNNEGISNSEESVIESSEHIATATAAAAEVEAAASALFHTILLHSTSMVNDHGGEWYNVLVHIDGFHKSKIQSTLFGRQCHTDDMDPISLQQCLPFFISHLNQYAFHHRGSEQGHVALQLLQFFGKRRVAYRRFVQPESFSNNGSNEERPLVPNHGGRKKEIVSLLKNVLTPNVVESLMDYVTLIRKRQWLSMNPDSVDGLPSLHLNLISSGMPLFGNNGGLGGGDGNEEAGSDGNVDGRGGEGKDISFEQCISEMVEILHSPLYETLLPAVRQLVESNTLEISDVFIRNYGLLDSNIKNDGTADAPTLCEDDEMQSPPQQKTRYGLSPHYDITAYATCVMALDSTAATGKNGLYTIPRSEMGVSNHAALREFFPLNKGDGVVHTFDVLHGVDVDPTLNQSRSSLIVWFTDSAAAASAGGGGGGGERVLDEKKGWKSPHPWLWNPSNHVDEFILALATECSGNLDHENDNANDNRIDPLALYLSSASQGNVFAMTQLGQLCDDDQVVDQRHLETMQNLLKDLDPSNPFLTTEDCEMTSKTLAAALWYHAGIKGGNRVAQVSLADELMLGFMLQKKTTSLDNIENSHHNYQQQQQTEEDLILMASTLFTMALFQGYDSSKSLLQLMDVNCQRLQDNGVEIPSETFFEDSVVKTLMLSL